MRHRRAARRRSPTRPTGSSPGAAARRSSRTHHGLVMAAAGIDASNTDAGHGRAAAPSTPTPRPARLRERAGPRHRRATSRSLVTDTAGRAWRTGQTDIADRRRRARRRSTTTPAAPTRTATSSRSPRRRSPTSSPPPPTWSRASSTGRPAAVVRGLPAWCCRAGEHGPGAAALVRAEAAGHVRPRRPRGGAQRPARGRPARLRRRRARPLELRRAALRARPSTRPRCGIEGRHGDRRGWPAPSGEQGAADARLRDGRVRAGLARADAGTGTADDGGRCSGSDRALRRLRRTDPRTAPHRTRAGDRWTPWPSRTRTGTVAPSSSRCARDQKKRRAPAHDRGHLRAASWWRW